MADYKARSFENNNLNEKMKNKETNSTGIIEYGVSININEVDKKGKLKNNGFAKIFDSEDMLTNRRDAISYYSDQREFFLSEKEFAFSSPYEAKIKNYKDFKCFGISLEVSDNDGNYFYLDGPDPESLFELLGFEADILKYNKNINFIWVEDCWGNQKQVLQEDYKILKYCFDEI